MVSAVGLPRFALFVFLILSTPRVVRVVMVNHDFVLANLQKCREVGVFEDCQWNFPGCHVPQTYTFCREVIDQ